MTSNSQSLLDRGVHTLIVGEAMCLCHFCDIMCNWGFGILKAKNLFSMVAHVLDISKF